MKQGKWTAEEKIAIVLEGIRGVKSVQTSVESTKSVRHCFIVGGTSLLRV